MAGSATVPPSGVLTRMCDSVPMYRIPGVLTTTARVAAATATAAIARAAISQLVMKCKATSCNGTVE